MRETVCVNDLLFAGEEFFRDYVLRLAVAENGEDLVFGVSLKECLDLSLDPHGFLGVGGADNDQVLGLFERIGERLGKVARDRELVLVPEDTCDLLVFDLSLKTAGHVEMLKLLLNM